jgi:hypothetical protein
VRPGRRVLLAVGVAGMLAALAACASTPKKPGTGYRTLEATVVERHYDPPGSGGASFAGSGNYYLVLEARDAEATATYRFEVTKMQYNRYVEGSHVQIVLADNELKDLRPLQ